jgi:hypothetical protein
MAPLLWGCFMKFFGEYCLSVPDEKSPADLKAKLPIKERDDTL